MADRAGPALPAFLCLGAVGVVLATVDVVTQRPPDAVVGPAYLAGLALLGIAAALGSDAGTLGRAVVAMFALFGFYLVLAVINPSGMGLGDSNWPVCWASTSVGSPGTCCWSALSPGSCRWPSQVVCSVAVGRTSRDAQLPFGPFMLGGALLGILLGHPIVSAYIG